MSMKIQRTNYVGRLAPSPTGLLHVGHAQTFYIAMKRAQYYKGDLLLRWEDLDKARCKHEFTPQMIEDLNWFLNFDFQADQIFKQSTRTDLYLEAWRELYNRGAIYPSPHSRKDVENALSAPHEGDQEIIFPDSLRMNSEDVPKSLLHPGKVNWRYRVPDGKSISFNDKYNGQVSYVAGEDFGDFVIWRADDVPSYELAVVVDDHEMGISEVVRGHDLLLSTARQILLYETLNYEIPDFFHCPLVYDKTGKRMAKRDSSTTLAGLRQSGYTPETIMEEFFDKQINYFK